jgi:hypothetical protein
MATYGYNFPELSKGQIAFLEGMIIGLEMKLAVLESKKEA